MRSVTTSAATPATTTPTVLGPSRFSCKRLRTPTPDIDRAFHLVSLASASSYPPVDRFQSKLISQVFEFGSYWSWVAVFFATQKKDKTLSVKTGRRTTVASLLIGSDALSEFPLITGRHYHPFLWLTPGLHVGVVDFGDWFASFM